MSGARPCRDRVRSRPAEHLTFAIGRAGATPVGVWAIKHLISPLDRLVARVSRGRLRPPSSLAVPSLLLTVPGRRSGKPRTVPLVFARDDDAFVVANARPQGERRNPWVLNLRAAGTATVRLGRRTLPVEAIEMEDDDIAEWWPVLTASWPAFAEHYAATGERSVFRLQPIDIDGRSQPIPPGATTVGTGARGDGRSDRGRTR